MSAAPGAVAATAVAAAGCQLLDWDSAFFGLRIGRATLARLDDESLAAVLDWCRAQAIDCLYFLAGAEDSETIRLAESGGFRLVDIRLTLQASLADEPAAAPPLGDGIELGLARSAEVGQLKAIARASHHDSRFYHDPGFSRADCDRLYETWIEKACGDPAGAVLVARRGQQAAGYLACGRQDAATGRISLVAIAPGFQRQGIGQALLAAAMNWFREQNFQSVSVVTQGRNVAAQRLYQRAGFVTQSVQLWYHRWFR